MRRVMGCLIMLSAVSFCAGIGCATDPMKKKEATPSMGERFTKDAVTGTLLKIDGEHYVIQEKAGENHRVHVDKSTKLDKVKEGDLVKAFVTDQGHVITLQRLEK